MTTLDPTQTLDITLTDRHREISAKARHYCDTYLLPLEERCDERDGLGADDLVEARAAVVEMELNGINMPRAWGGQEYSSFEQMLTHEQLGRATNALWDVPWRPSNVLRYATPEQVEEYVRPEIAGQRRHAYAITEEGAGSDPSVLQTKAVRDGDGWRITGEKWFVTTGDIADYFIVVADAEGHGLTSFLVDRNLAGVAEKRRPRFMHAFVFEHPEFTFDDVRVDDSKILGTLGGGLELTKEWFMDERLLIAARSLGGAERCLDVALAYAFERRQFGSRIFDYQAVAFQLADCAVELQAARAMTYQVAWEIDRKQVDPKTLHAKAASVKLFASQMGNRVADRCVQVLGGRGYMRENPVERLYRDLRVDRIWEGTDEIQKLIVANELAKRGRQGVCAWPGAAELG
jgi:alkylation response protein AidB-like acyl-CoA dehydrogenase